MTDNTEERLAKAEKTITTLRTIVRIILDHAQPVKELTPEHRKHIAEFLQDEHH